MHKQDKQAPLREDIRLLGKILGQTVKQQEGEAYFELVEKIRTISKKLRKEYNEKQEEELLKLIRGLKDKDTLILARAFGHFLNLSNIAETHHSVRSLKQDNENALSDQINILEELIPRMLSQGITKKKILDVIHNMDIELVLTAHPTEVKRRTLLKKNSEIIDLLTYKDRQQLNSYELDETKQTLEALITSIWQTDEIRRIKPTPVEEAKWGLAIIEEVLWNAVPKYIKALNNICQKLLDNSLDITCTPVKISTWMGGDRDGNPNVTAKVTYQVNLLFRWMAADLYRNEIDLLIQELSLKDCSEDLRKIVKNAREPYRAYLRKVRDKLDLTKQYYKDQIDKKSCLIEQSDIYTDPQDLMNALKLCYTSLIEQKAQAIADTRLLDILRRLSCFGLCLMKMDIRQESSRHTDVINKITKSLNIGSFVEWNEEEKQDFLIKECQNNRPLLPHNITLSREEKEVIETLKICAKLPKDSLGAYVISMASNPSDVLAVRLLQKEAQIAHPLRIVPLFETLSDLENSHKVINRLFSLPWYREDINDYQEIMIGYSDSGKDAGKMAASWAQYKAQEQLVAVGKKHNVTINLFHGRGGSVGRGGGPVEHALLSQAPGSVNCSLRVTEQGEVIQQKYSISKLAVFNLMQYTSSVIEATLIPPPKPKEEWRNLMEEMSQISCQEYRDIVQKNENFVQYFHKVTPERQLGKLSIGSRPAKRKKEGGIKSLRAIPWVFAWTQTRLMLPAWLGIQEAIKHAIATDKKDVLEDMLINWPFFYFFADMQDMVLTKADVKISKYYDHCLADEEDFKIGENLRNKLEKTIISSEKLMQKLPLNEKKELLKNSILVRNTYADPLNLLQGEIMRRIKTDSENEVLEDALMVTIAGIAAAMKNTG